MQTRQFQRSTRWATITAAALAVLGSVARQAYADGAPRSALRATGSEEASNVAIMVEVDPMPFALSGHAVHVRVPLPSVPGLVLSAGTYSMEFPALLTNINSKNRDKGWNADIDKAYAAFADYHFSGKPEGIFVGTQVAYQNFEVGNDQSEEQRDFGVMIAMARVGTLYRPFDSGFYLLPWAGVYANIRTDDNDLQIDGETFDVAPVNGFATLHVGWQF